MNEIESVLSGIKKNFTKYVINESIERIKKCLSALSNNEIWMAPNPNSNSIAHLILHLCGNGRQYIISGLGGQEDHRNRSNEFNTSTKISKEKIILHLEATGSEMLQIIDDIRVGQLCEIHNIQCFELTTLDAIIHVIEHFTYHTGQIVYQTKAIKNIDTAFYEGMDLG